MEWDNERIFGVLQKIARKDEGAMSTDLVVAIWFAWWGWDMLQTYGIRPADGGVLAPLWQRLAWALFLWAFGFGFLAGMWLYGTIYVSSLWFDETAKTLQVRTLGFIGSLGGWRKTYKLSDVAGARGLYLFAFVSGLTDVDAIALSSMRMYVEGRVPADAGVTAIAIALIANLLLKGATAWAIGGRLLAQRLVLPFGAMIGAIALARALALVA